MSGAAVPSPSIVSWLTASGVPGTQRYDASSRRRGREVRQRPAKPRTAVRIRSAPLLPLLAGFLERVERMVFASLFHRLDSPRDVRHLKVRLDVDRRSDRRMAERLLSGRQIAGRPN